MKIIRIVAIVFGIYVILGLLLDGAIGYFQPQSGETVVLRTYDDQDQSQDTVLGQLWVESGHWFRGWYKRVLANPSVELLQGDTVTPYTAVPVNTPEAVDLMTTLMGKGQGYGYWVGRIMLLFAPIKPVRLDPRPAANTAPE